jgi:hypothetical protein
MIKILIFIFLYFSAFNSFADDVSSKKISPEYRAWIYSKQCNDLNSKDQANAQYFMGLSFFAIDVYVELEKMGFKYIKNLLRAESLAKVDTATKQAEWLKLNKAKYKNESELFSATRKEFSNDSLGRYIQAQGIMDLKNLCECYNQEKTKQVPNVATFKSKSEQDLQIIDTKAKAICINSLYKKKSWFSW